MSVSRLYCMGLLPDCVVIPSETPDCGSLSDPENGNVNTSTGTTVGSEAVYSCNEGYDLNGPEIRSCSSDGTWSDTEPTCVGKLSNLSQTLLHHALSFSAVVRDCGNLTDPENGSVDLSEGTSFGSLAIYDCDLGYSLEGPDTRTCQSDGEWSDTAPTCMRKYYRFI